MARAETIAACGRRVCRRRAPELERRRLSINQQKAIARDGDQTTEGRAVPASVRTQARREVYPSLGTLVKDLLRPVTWMKGTQSLAERMSSLPVSPESWSFDIRYPFRCDGMPNNRRRPEQQVHGNHLRQLERPAQWRSGDTDILAGGIRGSKEQTKISATAMLITILDRTSTLKKNPALTMLSKRKSTITDNPPLCQIKCREMPVSS